MENRKKKLIIFALILIIICTIATVVMCYFETETIKRYYGKVDEETTRVHETDNGEYEQISDYYVDINEITTVNSITGDYNKFIFVGDSRYVGMQFLATEEDVFICESGEGFGFLESNFYNITSIADENTAVIIGLGVNDNLKTEWKDYVELITRLEDSTNSQIYYMLVNPVDEELEYYSGYNVKNADINYFNEQIVEGLDSSIGIIDTNSYLKSVGFETRDGLHYTDETYRTIYEYIKGAIQTGNY